MRKVVVIGLVVVMAFVFTACGGEKKGDITDEKGIVSFDLAGDFEENPDYKFTGYDRFITGAGVGVKSDSKYYGNSLRPEVLVGVAPNDDVSAWIDNEISVFHSYLYAENKKVEDVEVAGMEGKVASYEDSSSAGKILKRWYVAGDKDKDGNVMILKFISGSGGFDPLAEEDLDKMVQSVKVDQKAFDEAIKELNDKDK